jgi:hypothetical protein
LIQQQRVHHPETCTVKVVSPPAEGVPPMAFSERPTGRDPALTDQVYGVLPPEAANENQPAEKRATDPPTPPRCTFPMI